MALIFRCPRCDKRFNVSGDMAGKKAQCTCGKTFRITKPRTTTRVPVRRQPPQLIVVEPAAIAVYCPGCQVTLQVAVRQAGKKVRCRCGTLLQVPDSSESGETASLFDELTENDLLPQLEPEPQKPIGSRKSEAAVLGQYTQSSLEHRVRTRTRKRKNGYFAPERRGLGYGMVGGLAMMLLAVVWFFGGLAAGFIFFYPPIHPIRNRPVWFSSWDADR